MDLGSDEVMERLRAFFADKHGLRREGEGPVVVAGEAS
jgi:hypothetical protein